MNKKEIKNLPNYIRTILFYVNNVHWSNNLTINRSVLTTKVTKKYLNQISINLEDHKEAMILFKRHYNSNNEQNRPYVIEYLAHIKNIRDNNQHSIHNF